MIEIERKFLVESQDFVGLSRSAVAIKQGYLCSHPERTVRVRTKGTKGFLTIKGASSEDGTSRYEFEKEISFADALDLLALCEGFFIEKTRYEVIFEGMCFEIDVFEGENEGLILAEVELESANQQVQLPSWIGEEVTGNPKFYNAYLSKKPFKHWDK